MKILHNLSDIIKQSASKSAGLLLLVLAFTFSACAGSSTNHGDNGHTEPPPSPPPTSNEVVLGSNNFSPSSLQVTEGTTVTWKNNSSMVHTVTSGENGTYNGTFDSGNIPPAGS